MPPIFFFFVNDFPDNYNPIEILSLSFRREIHDLSFIFNCFHGKFDCNV